MSAVAPMAARLSPSLILEEDGSSLLPEVTTEILAEARAGGLLGALA